MTHHGRKLESRCPAGFRASLLYFWLSMLALGAWPATGLGLPLEQIKLPPGFEISVYATGVNNARSMTLSPNGMLFVGTRSAGNVYAIVDRNGDFQADEVITLARGLNSPADR